MCSSNEGAVLILPDGGSRCNLRPLNKFREYAMLQAEKWYQFVNGQLSRMVSDDSLYLVTGLDKTSSWGVASISNLVEKTAFSLTVTATDDTSIPATRRYAWDRTGQVTARAGPRHQARYENQCIFIRGYKISVREDLISAALKGPANVSHIIDLNPSDVLAKSDSFPGAPKSSLFTSWYRSGGSRGGSSESAQDLVEAEFRDSYMVEVEAFPLIEEVKLLDA
jgi:hypothetical protein